MQWYMVDGTDGVEFIEVQHNLNDVDPDTPGHGRAGEGGWTSS